MEAKYNASSLLREFITAEGKTVAVLTLTPADIRPRQGEEILHVRKLASV